MITITDNAKTQMLKLLEEHGKDMFRFSISSGGCSGFTYKLEFASEEDIDDLDKMAVFDNLKVVIDSASLMYIMGTEIDWVNDVMGTYFVYNNPLAANSCGCGTSFSV